MSSGLVDRLAKKWGVEHFNSMRPAPLTESGDRYEARWFLLAIAEELEAQYKTRGGGDKVARHNRDAAEWLRNQAGAESSE